MSEKSPLLSQVLQAAIDGKLDDVRVALPGEILDIDKTTGCATVQILVNDRFIGEDGQQQNVVIAPLVGVPVAQLGLGSVRVKIPVRKGAKVWLSFSSSSIAKLKAGTRGPVDPGSDRHHHLADAIAEPWTYLGEDDDGAMIEFTDDGLIKAGGDQPLVTKAEFDTHTHPAPGGATSAPTTPATGSSKLRG